eukprot:Pgem_evm1s5449
MPAALETKPNVNNYKRRTRSELERKVVCDFPGCGKLYASYHACRLHVRLKHVSKNDKSKSDLSKVNTKQNTGVQVNKTSIVPINGGGGGSSTSQTRRLSFQQNASLSYDMINVDANRRRSSLHDTNNYPSISSNSEYFLPTTNLSTNIQNNTVGEIDIRRRYSLNLSSLSIPDVVTNNINRY